MREITDARGAGMTGAAPMLASVTPIYLCFSSRIFWKNSKLFTCILHVANVSLFFIPFLYSLYVFYFSVFLALLFDE